jgi:dTDP-4-dehydrorhamnose reductase
MRIVVTGRDGQVARAMAEVGPTRSATIVLVGRPLLDLADPSGVLPALREARPDIVVNAAAYTAVDKAESEPNLAMAVNGHGAGAVAEAAKTLGVPVIQISSDYVFDGSAVSRGRCHGPDGRLRQDQAGGRGRGRRR